MKQSSRYLQETMKKASDLQTRYTALGAPKTQNVRNPLPLHKLVLTVIPTLPKKEVEFVTFKPRTVMAFGKLVTVTPSACVSASEALGTNFRETGSKSAAQIVNDLRAKGFIVNALSVRQTLTNLKSKGAINGVRGQRGKTYLGSPALGAPSLKYFVGE